MSLYSGNFDPCPEDERPFPWVLFIVGVVVAVWIFA